LSTSSLDIYKLLNKVCLIFEANESISILFDIGSLDNNQIIFFIFNSTLSKSFNTRDFSKSFNQFFLLCSEDNSSVNFPTISDVSKSSTLFSLLRSTNNFHQLLDLKYSMSSFVNLNNSSLASLSAFFL